MRHLSIDAVRSEALFVSALQPSERPRAEQIQKVITQAVRGFGSRGCAERVAQEFGDHPEIAVIRMTWARRMVDEAFGGTRLEPAPAHPRQLAQPIPAHAARAA